MVKHTDVSSYKFAAAECISLFWDRKFSL